MTIQLTGVNSGIDFDTFVEATLVANGGPLARLQRDEAEWKTKLAAVSDLESRMGNLEDLVETLSDMTNLRHVSAASSDSDVIGATSSAGAGEGTYSFEVNQLASAEKEVHDGVATLETALGGGTFVYTYNGETRVVQTAAEATLETLQDRINNDAGNPGVRASILEYDDGLGGVFHLVLTGLDAGADKTITIEATTTLSGFEPGGENWTQTRTARDAQFRVDGYPAGDWITSSTNTLGNVVPNATVTLHGIGTATLTLNRNYNPLKTDLSNLVAIYNGIVDTLDTYTGYDEATSRPGIMQGDSTLNLLVASVRATLTGPVSGFTSEDSFTMAARIGLEIDKDGHLALDESKLDEALAEDYLGVLRLIGASGTGGTDNTGLQFDSALSSTQSGTYEVEVDYDAAGGVTAGRIRLSGETSWRSMVVDAATLTGDVGYPEQGMALTVITPGVSETIPYEIRVQQGFAGSAYDRLEEIMNQVDGAFVTKKNQIDLTLTSLGKQIDRQEERLLAMEERLTEKYARLEATLAQLEGLNAAFASLFQVLANNQSQTNR